MKNPQSLNLYTYVENNPLKYHDPNGNAPYIDKPNRSIGPGGMGGSRGGGSSNPGKVPKTEAPKNTKGSGNSTKSSFKADLLRKDLKYTERYGENNRVELPDGRIRYKGEIEPAKKPGEMVGRRVVQELDPKTGNVRTWQETLDNSGNIRQVRPQFGPVKTHYRFDINGKYVGKW